MLVEGSNLVSYIQAVVDATLGSGIEVQLQAFREGFNEVRHNRTTHGVMSFNNNRHIVLSKLLVISMHLFALLLLAVYVCASNVVVQASHLLDGDKHTPLLGLATQASCTAAAGFQPSDTGGVQGG